MTELVNLTHFGCTSRLKINTNDLSYFPSLSKTRESLHKSEICLNLLATLGKVSEYVQENTTVLHYGRRLVRYIHF